MRVTRRQQARPYPYTRRRYNHMAIWWVTETGSLALMLQVATPANTIIFGIKSITVIQMTKTGFVLNLIGINIVSIIIYSFGTLIVDIDEGVYPEWRQIAN